MARVCVAIWQTHSSSAAHQPVIHVCQRMLREAVCELLAGLDVLHDSEPQTHMVSQGISSHGQVPRPPSGTAVQNGDSSRVVDRMLVRYASGLVQSCLSPLQSCCEACP